MPRNKRLLFCSYHHFSYRVSTIVYSWLLFFVFVLECRIASSWSTPRPQSTRPIFNVVISCELHCLVSFFINRTVYRWIHPHAAGVLESNKRILHSFVVHEDCPGWVVEHLPTHCSQFLSREIWSPGKTLFRIDKGERPVHLFRYLPRFLQVSGENQSKVGARSQVEICPADAFGKAVCTDGLCACPNHKIVIPTRLNSVADLFDHSLG